MLFRVPKIVIKPLDGTPRSERNELSQDKTRNENLSFFLLLLKKFLPHELRENPPEIQAVYKTIRKPDKSAPVILNALLVYENK